MSDITTQVRAFRSQIIDHLLAKGCPRELAGEIAREAFITATQTTVTRLGKKERGEYLCAIADRHWNARQAALLSPVILPAPAPTA